MSNTALGAALTIDDSVLEKITEAENRIIRLEQTTRTSADKIAKSFRSVGDVGVQYFIDKLKLAQNELNKISVPKIDFGQSINFGQVSQQATLLAESVTKASVAINQYYSSTQKSNRKTTISTEEERKAYIQKYEMYKKMFDQIERNEKRAIKAAENEAKAQEQAAQRIIAAARRQYAEQAKLYQQQNLKQNTTYQGALSFAESANTINRRTKAIQYLTQARAQLSSTDANYEQKLKALNAAIKRMNAENEKAVQGARNLAQQHSNLMNTSDQLARKLALIFSVSQIQGYVNKLIQVRGEFELQNTALASILQNKDQADKLFGQITELAVQSPFTVKELTTYTKSLAAYQFQYEELYDTTKRLADVASGLGVDMQRLILAVGQVKAAGYLRGTETRQFTEAGFNILGELAKYYSELEGRIVSVGEVQERQFKRMIAFQDVEEVFRRVTDAGGMFYQMQEKQAETLAGQMSNLKDSIDLMLNSIGKANEGTIKDMVAMVRSIVENWRDVETAMNALLTMFGPYLAYMALAKVASSKFALNLLNIATNSTKVTKALDVVSNKVTALSTKMNLGAKGAKVMTTALGGLATLGVGAAISGLIAGMTYLYVEMTKASREAENLKNSLTNIASEGFVRSAELSRTFETLAEKAVEAADGSKEQQMALEELQRTYKDIVPEEQLRIENLRALKGEYESVTTAIYSKIQADIKEKQIQEVGNTYGKDFAESLDALAKRLSKYNISLEKSRAIVEEFRKEIEKGTISTSTTARKYLEDLIARATEAKVTLTDKGFVDTAGGKTWGDVVIEEIDDVLGAYTKFYVEVDKINNKPIQFFNVKATPLYSELKSQFEDIAKLKEQWDEQNKDKFSLKVEFNEESKNALIAQYQKFIQDVQSQMSSGKIQPKDFVSANLIIEEAQKAIEKLDVSPQIAQINDLRVEFSKLYNIDFEKFNFTKMLEGQGFNDFIKRLDEGIKGYQEIIDVFDEAARQGTEVPAMQRWALLQGKTIEEIRTLVPVLEEYRDKVALVTKEEDKRGGKDTTSQTFKNQLSFLQRANSEYEKLLKNYSAEQAKLQVINAMKAEAAELGVSDIFLKADFDDSGILAAIELLKTKFASLSPEMATALAKAISTIQIDMDVELREGRIKTIQDQFSDLFGNYELSLELDKLGLDKGLASDLFGVEIFDLTELRKRAEVYKDELQNILGKEGVSAWDAINKQITDAETKELQERLKNYAKYLKKSVSERVRIEQDAQKEIAKVQETKQLTTEQKVQVTAAISKETNEKLASLAFKEFKGTDLYAKVFDDLGRAGDLAITTLLQRLDEFSKTTGKNLPINEFKELIGVLKKVREEAESRALFGTLVSGLKEWQESISEVAKAEQDLETIINGGSVIDSTYIDANGKIVTTMLTRAKAEENLIKAQDKQRNAQTKVANSAKSIQQAYSQVASSISSALSQFQEFAEAMGAELSPEMQGLIDGMAKGFSLVATALGVVTTAMIAATAAGTALMTVLWPLLAIGAAIGAIFAISAIHDNKRQVIIDREQEKIDKLQSAYDDLTRTIEKGVSLLKYTESAGLTKNLQEQIDSYERMIAAEKDKKKSDEDQIKQWEDSIKDLTNQIADTYDDLREELVGNFKSLAEELGDAIVNAFVEGENAATKWGESVNDIIKNILQNLLIQKYLEPQLQKAIDDFYNKSMANTSAAEGAYGMVESALNKVNELQAKWDSMSVFDKRDNAGVFEQLIAAKKEYQDALAEWEKLNAAAAGEIPQITEDATNQLEQDLIEAGNNFQSIIENLPEDLRKYFEGSTSGDTMSGLQKGIQGITEETAQALEALLNSMRYFVSDSNLQLRSILATLTAPAPENPFLLELKAQTEQLRTMNSLWNSLSKTSTGNGKVLKVQIV